MALQDLTPQLRTRLSRMERAVGWFVVLALALLGFGFGYYVYHTAERKGWFLTKAAYFTYVHSATGLRAGDPVRLMGFEVGRISLIDAERPFQPYDVYVEFEINSPYEGYILTEGSLAKVAIAGLLEQRVLEVTKGTNGYAIYTKHTLRDVSLEQAKSLADASRWGLAQEVFDPRSRNLIGKPWQPLTNLAAFAAAGYTTLRIVNKAEKHEKHEPLTGIWNRDQHRYDFYSKTNKPYWLEADETPAVTEQAQRLVSEVEAALPSFLNLTNQLTAVLSNAATLTSNLNAVALAAQPAARDLAGVTAHLDHPGALGEWLLPTNINRQLESTLGNASSTMASANTNLASLVENLNRSLDNLAAITGNLNSQVAANSNLVRSLSDAIVHADEFVQGLKHHWLLRSAFKSKATNAPPPLLSPKQKGR